MSLEEGPELFKGFTAQGTIIHAFHEPLRRLHTSYSAALPSTVDHVTNGINIRECGHASQ